jgi:GrpB-like predicted nucleotidyltransferase (UPF0157 family)
MILGLERGSLRLVPHQAGWRQAFDEETLRLKSALGVPDLAIEHVGSTAVPGLVAKPVIDVAIAVDSFGQTRAWPEALAPLEYAYFGDRHGWRDDFYAKGPETLRTFYLHVVEGAGDRWRNYLLFRDQLRASPGLREEYRALKLAAAAPGATRDSYTSAKEAFINRVLAG